MGSTTIHWVRKFFLNTNEMVESPSQGVKMYRSFLDVYVQIWYLKR